MNRYLDATVSAATSALPNFKHVRIDYDRLHEVAEVSALQEFVLPAWDFAGVQPTSHRAFVSHCFWWSVINFCYGHSHWNGDGQIARFRARHDGVVLTGAYAMGSRFYRLFGEKPILSADLFPYIETYSRFKKIFRGINSMPLLKKRFECLREACWVLAENFHGDPSNLLEECRWHAFSEVSCRRGVVELLVGGLFPKAFGNDWFCDSNDYFSPDKTTFYFYKRAQLFPLEYHGRAMASKGTLRPIADVENIGPIADYQLPKSYFIDGVLVYSEELKRDIEFAVPLPRHSQEEVEIRLAFILAHQEELRIINELRGDKGLPLIHVGHLDYYRWERGRSAKHLNHHLCYTTDY